MKSHKVLYEENKIDVAGSGQRNQILSHIVLERKTTDI